MVNGSRVVRAISPPISKDDGLLIVEVPSHIFDALSNEILLVIVNDEWFGYPLSWYVDKSSSIRIRITGLRKPELRISVAIAGQNCSNGACSESESPFVFGKSLDWNFDTKLAGLGECNFDQAVAYTTLPILESFFGDHGLNDFYEELKKNVLLKQRDTLSGKGVGITIVDIGANVGIIFSQVLH